MTRPVILNQLGPEIGGALAAHPSRPLVRDAVDRLPPWEVEDADVLVTRPSEAWQRAPRETPGVWPGRLRWVQVASAGTDWFPRWLFDGPVVTCGRGNAAAPIAEYVLAAILLHEKRLDAVTVRDASDWRRHTLGTLEGRVLGLAGFGAIGRAVAARAAAFGMRIAALRRGDWEADAAPGIERVPDLATLASISDHLVLAMPLTPETRGAASAAVFAHAKPGLHLVNIARGGLVDQDALIAALDDGRIGFATLDVTDPEPLPPAHRLLTHARVRVTPHVSWSGGESMARLTRQILANLTAYVEGSRLAEIVDPVRGY